MGARFDAVKQRAVVLKAVLRRPLAIYIAAAWTVFSTLATLRDNFLPEKLRGALQVLKLIPKLPWWVWSLGVLAILLVSVIEGAYQEIKRRDLVIEQRAPL